MIEASTLEALAVAVSARVDQSSGCDQVELLGRHALARTDVADAPSEEMLHDYLWSLQFTVSGGTSQVQRNIIAERILGLPREPRP